MPLAGVECSLHYVQLLLQDKIEEEQYVSRGESERQHNSLLDNCQEPV